MSKITCNLKTIVFREFCANLLFTYFGVSYNIAKFQTSSSWHSRVIATFAFAGGYILHLATDASLVNFTLIESFNSNQIVIFFPEI